MLYCVWGPIKSGGGLGNFWEDAAGVVFWGPRPRQTPPQTPETSPDFSNPRTKQQCVVCPTVLWNAPQRLYSYVQTCPEVPHKLDPWTMHNMSVVSVIADVTHSILQLPWMPGNPNIHNQMGNLWITSPTSKSKLARMPTVSMLATMRETPKICHCVSLPMRQISRGGGRLPLGRPP